VQARIDGVHIPGRDLHFSAFGKLDNQSPWSGL